MQTALTSLAFVLLLLPAFSNAEPTPMSSEEHIVRLEKLLKKTQSIFDLNFRLYRRDVLKALEQARKDIEPLRVHAITQACSKGVERKKNCALFAEVVEKTLRDSINSYGVGKVQNTYSGTVRSQLQVALSDEVLTEEVLTTLTDKELGMFTSRDAENERIARIIELRKKIYAEVSDAILAKPLLAEDKIVDAIVGRPMTAFARQPRTQAYDAVDFIQAAIDVTARDLAKIQLRR